MEEPFNYTAALKGKDLRSEFIQIFAKWIGGVDEKRISVVKAVISTLHNASLMIDDIEDEAELRRGELCAYKVFGIALTLNSANLAYFKALEQVLSLEDFAAVKNFTNECIALHRGQGMEILFRDTGKKPNELEYYEMIEGKTGGLLRLAMLLLSPANDVGLVQVANEIGVIYQMIDDYRNLFCRVESEANFADDLREGKFTLATIHGLESLEKTPELSDRIDIVQKLRLSGSDVYALEVIKTRIDKFKSTNLALPGISAISSHFENLLYSQ